MVALGAVHDSSPFAVIPYEGELANSRAGIRRTELRLWLAASRMTADDPLSNRSVTHRLIHGLKVGTR